MSRRMTLLLGIVVTGALAATWMVRATAEAVTGVVIDLSCYARNRSNTGMDHDQGRNCAWACIKYEGQPAGLLTADGKVYQIAGALAANNNARIAPHLGHTVTINGDVEQMDGMLMLSGSDVVMSAR